MKLLFVSWLVAQCSLIALVISRKANGEKLTASTQLKLAKVELLYLPDFLQSSDIL